MYAGDVINAPWSSRATVLKVVFFLLVQTADQDFYGVLYSNPDPLRWDWPSPNGSPGCFAMASRLERGRKPARNLDLQILRQIWK